MAGWGEYGLAFLAFFASHALPVRPPVKRRLVALFGAAGFTAVYSILSLVVLAWLIEAAGRAPYVPLWGWAAWQPLVPQVAMVPVCLILSFALGRPNPFSFGGLGNHRFDAAEPGIVRWTRHPILLAAVLWAAAHMVANGDLAHALLFATFAVFAALGMGVIDRRKRREMGGAWQALAGRVGAVPLVARPRSWVEFALRTAAAAALYLALVWAHPWLFGVLPFY